MLRTRFRIQYASDLHLERYASLPPFESFLKPAAPYLALAGDIGHPTQLRELFAWAAPKWNRIFYVAGNHEYYGAKYEKRLEELKELVQPYENLHFLHASTPSFFCEEENVAVIGSTLWTEVANTSSWRSVADYTQIKFKQSVYDELNALHHAEKAVLDGEICRWTDQGALICVITHHLPSFRLLHPRFDLSTVNDCFASASDNLIRSPVRLWIYGHSHAVSHQVVNKVLCVANPKGYAEENVVGWRPDVWMEFPTMDPQEAEAIAKMDQTPLRTSTYLEDSEVDFM